ncbi:hypothetical protein L209DRAFT_795903 [Thermothelomyces heterothallicus CBS 203.75]
MSPSLPGTPGPLPIDGQQQQPSPNGLRPGDSPRSTPTETYDQDVSDCESDVDDESSTDVEKAVTSSTPSAATLPGTPPRPSKARYITESGVLPNDADPFEAHGLDSSPLPPKRSSIRAYRFLRWNFGSVYRRIFTLVYLGNMAALAVFVARRAKSGDPSAFTHQQASTAATANILAAVIVRNEHVVNALFWVFVSPWTRVMPLHARTLAAKVYSYGGIHSGGAVSATFWYIAFLVLLTIDFRRTNGPGPVSSLRGGIYAVSYAIIVLLVSMLASAHPEARRRVHNWFEGIHRFMGWTAVALFWALVVLLAADSVVVVGGGSGGGGGGGAKLGRALAASPSFWMLVVITLLIAYPWTRLRMRDVEAEVLSPHCLKLTFRHRDVHYGQAVRLTDSPLKETHAFGVIPGIISSSSSSSSSPSPTPVPSEKAGAEQGFTVLVSNAGDWTHKLIKAPPERIYTRGAPQFGVLRVAALFSPCVVVATGSGIAPCLGILAAIPTPESVRVLWATRDPLATYGPEVLSLVRRADPNAVVLNTGKGRRPDLVKLVYRLWEQERLVGGGRGKEKAEAVVIISNQRVTEKVVYGLEARGVPAFGAIFDS